jgi:homoserine O-acetyltransferase
MARTMAIQAIKNDPDWKNGDYDVQPRGLIAARAIRSLVTGGALRFHAENPSAAKADAAVEAMAKAALQGDANDTIYQYEASTGYDPSPLLEKIQAPLFAVNSADDEINPPELGILEREITRVKRGRYILIPLSDQTRGHQSYNRAGLWKNYLLELLHMSEPPIRSAASVLRGPAGSGRYSGSWRASSSSP